MSTTDKIVVRHLCKVFGPRPEDALPLIRQGLHKDQILARTGQTVGVRDVGLSVRAGEIFVVMGLSGSGKSTLVRMLNRLVEPTSGEVLIDGKNIAWMSRAELIALRRTDVAMVFQSFALLPHLSALENAAFGLDVAGVGRLERRDRAMHALKQVDLEDYAHSYPDELSGGMKQRVGLARALATDPSVMLMDEAFSALDPLIRREMQEELLNLQEQRKRTIVFVSHDLDEAMRLGDRIAMMEGGAITQIGTPRQVLEHPAAEYIQEFFKDVDVSQIYAAEHATERDLVVFRPGGADTPEAMRRVLEQRGHDYGYVVDDAQRLLGVVSVESLQGAGDAETAFLVAPTCLRADKRLGEVLGKVATTRYPVPVVGRNRRFMGAVSRASLLTALEKGA